ncbi:GGDEF domain-containing protein [Emcibacter nanhaiensis]|uniref:diguanylate cyclase n=1 Tax=Emcibacter nanhaiensis TaxID=1505037 RepID=A0A501PTN6_9PROT|nr:GGDEF domain-containing protein [Emcibacter nanhaiensis]TPD63081.1 GGDEF domain-containing protein [Emcibacter nanhaiensis]
MSFIQDRDDIEFIRETSDKALDQMSEYNVVPTPMNYHVWYTHSAGSDLSLSSTINSLIGKTTRFSSEICENLYQRFFSGEMTQSALEEAGQSIQKELVKIAQTLKESGDSTSEYSSSLTGHMDNLENIEAGSEISAILYQILADTRRMQEKSQKMEADLKASSQEIQKLQSSLAAVRQENMTDMLTNIGNRKCFENELDHAFKECEANQTGMSLLIGDVDHFKKFNDTWGHQVGDQVLKAVAHVMKLRIGEKGTPARFGGEEFCVVLPDVEIAEAVELADAIRESVSQRSMKRKSTGERIGKITVSFGVAEYRAGDRKSDIIARADEALYLAKKSGRNLVKAEIDLEQKIAKTA